MARPLGIEIEDGCLGFVRTVAAGPRAGVRRPVGRRSSCRKTDGRLAFPGVALAAGHSGPAGPSPAGLDLAGGAVRFPAASGMRSPERRQLRRLDDAPVDN